MSRITPDQERAIEALVLGAKVSEVAEALAVDRRTVSRWKAEPYFASELDRRRRELADEARAATSAAVGKAVDTLVAALDAPDARDRIRAAESILDRAGLGTTQRIEVVPVVPVVDPLVRLRELLLGVDVPQIPDSNGPDEPSL